MVIVDTETDRLGARARVCELAYTTGSTTVSLLIKYPDEDARAMWQRLASGMFSRGKVATWKQNVREGRTHIVSVKHASNALAQALRTHGPDVWAYNCAFDRGALRRSGIELPDCVKWRDIWPYAQCITSTRRYCGWAALHGRMTPNGAPQTSVDAVGAYLFGDAYSETHVARDDARDEMAILQRVQGRHAVRPKHVGAGNVGARKTWQAMRDRIRAHSVVLDMDGTCADFYNVDGWLDAIKSRDVHPYRDAKPMGEGVLHALNVARTCGARVHVVTWGPRDAPADYVERVGIAKVQWLHRHSIGYDSFHYLPYGAPKTLYGDTIVDDDINNRKAYRESGKLAISPTVTAQYVLDVLSR